MKKYKNLWEDKKCMQCVNVAYSSACIKCKDYSQFKKLVINKKK